MTGTRVGSAPSTQRGMSNASSTTFRSTSAGDRPLIESADLTNIKTLNRATSASSPRSTTHTSKSASARRPGTAIGTSAEGELRGTLRTTIYADEERGETFRTTIHQKPEITGILLSRGGIQRPRSAVIFATARRPETQVGNGATVPFHYNPPPLLARDPTTQVKNAPKVPFAESTRDQWIKVHMTVTSSPMAGPGAYDTNVDFMSTKKIFPTQSFPESPRKLGADPIVSPAPYDLTEANKSFYKRSPRAVMCKTGRPGSGIPIANNMPGPTIVNFIQRYRPHIRFSTAPGHDIPPQNLVSASVPIRDCERVRKHKPVLRFSSAPRFSSAASSF